MGRRSRAREREAAAVAARSAAAAPARGTPRRRWAQLLNPFKLQRPSRSRVRNAAVGFGLAGVLFAVIGWLTGEPTWFNSAVLLVILALAWGARAAFMREDDRSS